MQKIILKSVLYFMFFIYLLNYGNTTVTKSYFKKVDQVLWVVEDLENVIDNWAKLGFNQVIDFGIVDAECKTSGKAVKLRLAKANLGGANITWIQPLKSSSIFSEFHSHYGDGAMSLIHRMDSRDALNDEITRLADIGVHVLEEITFIAERGEFSYILMDTAEKGKYVLGYTYGGDDLKIRKKFILRSIAARSKTFVVYIW